MPFIDTNALPIKEAKPGWKGRYFSSERMTFGYYEVTAGSTLHEHEHDNEEVWHLLAGEFEITIAGRTQVAGPGMVAIVPPDTLHRVTARTDGRAIVVDQPRRAVIGGVRTD